MSKNKLPSPEEIKKEFEQFIQDKFGNQLHVVAQNFSTKKNIKKNTPPSDSKKDDQKMCFTFNYKPKDIKAYLDKVVIGQEEAKKTISIALCDHYNQVNAHLKKTNTQITNHHVKQNILILGPTGVGKTYLIKQAAKLIGVPFVKADATRFSETGYMGSNVDDIIKELVSQANGDLTQAEYGIVYLDEIDKLATYQNTQGNRDVSGRGVQTGLLKLMEETDIDLKANHDPASQMQAFMELQQKGTVERQLINTRYILFIFSGSFNKLDETISKRLNKKSIGFEKNNTIENTEKILQLATTNDFVEFGLEPEFIGRIPIRVACHNLEINSLQKILSTSEESILKQYIADFKGYGIRTSFSADAILEIAKLAYKEKTGARGLFTICEKILRHYKYELPSTHIKTLHITKQIVLTPKQELSLILQNVSPLLENTIKGIRLFEREFLTQYQINLFFEEDAMYFIQEESQKQNKTIVTICRDYTKNYEYGLKLIHQNTGQSKFCVNSHLLKNPKKELEKKVKESYQLMKAIT